MSWIERKIAAIICKSLVEHPDMQKTLTGAIQREIEAHPAFQLILGGTRRLIEASPALASKDAWEKSRQCLLQFLKDEKIKFGAPGYSWDADAGRILVEEYEIEYWEAS